MRDLTRIALEVLNSEAYSPVDLLEIRAAGATTASTIYLSNAGEEIEFGGNIYSAVNFSRSEMMEALSTGGGDHPSISVTLSNVDGQLATLLGRLELEGCRARLLTHDRRLLLKYPDRTRDAIVLINGEIRNPTLSESILSLDVVGIMSILEDITVPRRIYEKRCGKTFGSLSCGVDISVSPYTIETTVLSGTTRQFIRVSDSVLTEAGDPDNPTEFWRDGVVIVKDGDYATQGRPIHRVVVGGGQRRFWVKSPFLGAPAPGDTVIIRKGCGGHTKAACEGNDNLANFGGFEEQPHGDLPVIKPIRGGTS